MPKRYSPEIRRTALELVNQGQTQIEVAQALGVSPKTLSHWVTTTQARMVFCRLFPYAFSCRLAALSRPPCTYIHI